MVSRIVRLNKHSCRLSRWGSHTPKEPVLKGHEIVVWGAHLCPEQELRGEVGKEQVGDDLGQGQPHAVHTHDRSFK